MPMISCSGAVLPLLIIAEQSNHRAGEYVKGRQCTPSLSGLRPTCFGCTYICMYSIYVSAVFISQRHNQGNASKHLSAPSVGVSVGSLRLVNCLLGHLFGKQSDKQTVITQSTCGTVHLAQLSLSSLI